MEQVFDGIFSTVFMDDKVVHKIYKNNEYVQTAAELFANEIEVMEALNDLPYVPVVLCYSNKNCAMTTMPGKTLQECNIYLLKEKANDILEAVSMFASIVYDRGYLVNDIHYGNILIDYKEGLSIVDFNSYIPIDKQAEALNRHYSFRDKEDGYNGTRAAAMEFIDMQLNVLKTMLEARLQERGHTDVLLKWQVS